MTKQVLEVDKIPESLGELMEWCEKNAFYEALARHNDPSYSFCMPLFSALVIGSDIKAKRQLIHINFSSVWLLVKCSSGHRDQMGGAAQRGCNFRVLPRRYRYDCAQLLLLWWCQQSCLFLLYIPRQSKGENPSLYTVTYFGLQKAVLSLIKANTDKECVFSTCLKHLLSRPQQYLDSGDFLANKFPIDQAQCDQLAGWACFSCEILGMDPNVCGNHLTGMHRIHPAPFRN